MSRFSPESRLSLYYAALFASIGTVAPFFAVWLDSLGIDTTTIGIIAAAPSVLMVFTTVFIGRWADGLTQRRTAIIVCNVLILLLQMVLFVPSGPWLILVVWSLSGILMHAMVPVTDAEALSVTTRRSSDFARVRVFGSIGFIIAVAVSGVVYEKLGMVAFVPVVLLGNAVRLWLSTALPGGESPRLAPQRDAGSAGSGSALRSPLVVLTIIAAALIQASHAVVYTFGILLWTEHGLSETTGSLLIAIGVVAEVWLMWRFKSLTHQWSARACLLVAAALGVVRWGLLATAPPLPVVYIAQLLHAATFGLTYLATATFIARRVGEADAARGQGLAAIFTTAALAAATFIAGRFYDVMGAELYWLMAWLCVFALGLLALTTRVR